MTFSIESIDDTMLSAVLDAMPSAVLVLNQALQIIDTNRAADDLIQSLPGPDDGLLEPGNALHCLHAREHPDGCGHASVCSDCVIRKAIADALAGKDSLRLRTRMNLRLGGQRRDVYFQITATGFHHQKRHLALLVLEDISEYMELRQIVPICAQCKKIRQDENYWQSVEKYVGRHMDLSFSHSYCPTCKQDILSAIGNTAVTARPDGLTRSMEG